MVNKKFQEYLKFQEALIELELFKFAILFLEDHEPQTLENCQPRVLNSGVIVFVQKGTDKIFYGYNGKIYELTREELGKLDAGTHKTQTAFCFPDEIEFR